MERIEWAACIQVLMDAVYTIMMLVLTNVGGIIFALFGATNLAFINATHL